MEMTLNLRDLLHRVLLKWRIIVLCALILCVLFTVIGTINSAVDHAQASAALEAQTAAGGSQEGELPIVVPAFKAVDISYMILGVFVGVVGSAGVFMLKYMLSPTLRIAEDMENTFHIPVLCVIKTEQHFSGKFQKIDCLIHKLLSVKESENAVPMACAQIRASAQQNNAEALLFTGSGDTSELEQYMQQISNPLLADISNIQMENSLVASPAAVDTLSKANGVVLFEKINVSAYKNIERAAAMCQRYQVPILGCVVIE